MLHTLFLMLLLLHFTRCSSHVSEISENDSKEVTIDSGSIFLNGQAFFPMAINYKVVINHDSAGLWISPAYDYIVNDTASYLNKNKAISLIKADFRLMKEMGFNTVRIVGAGEQLYYDYLADIMMLSVSKSNGPEKRVPIQDTLLYQGYFDCLDSLFSIAGTENLKVILLAKMYPVTFEIEHHFANMARHFRENRTLIAYDLFNEPLYFDSLERKKVDVVKITKRWKKILKNNAPNHLMTLGLVGIREAFEWDPTIVDADFLSFHPYEFEREQVRNEMAWYCKYVKKPWIIGETSIPADNDSISYNEQKVFAEKTLNQAIACGAIGYSWWQYKDVNWGKYHSDFMGVISRHGTTFTTIDSLKIEGTVKPVAEVFKNYDFSKTSEIALLPNYYNYSSQNNFLLKGRVVDKNKKAISNGVIIAWNQDWTKSYHTVTKSDGSFVLGSDFKLYHYRVTGLGRESTPIYGCYNRFKPLPDGSQIVNVGSVILGPMLTQ
jgi:hypothetical protein